MLTCVLLCVPGAELGISILAAIVYFGCCFIENIDIYFGHFALTERIWEFALGFWRGFGVSKRDCPQGAWRLPISSDIGKIDRLKQPVGTSGREISASLSLSPAVW